MKCIECGHELKDGAVFCIRCGAMQVSMDGREAEANSAPVKPAVKSAQGASGRHNATTTGKSFKPTPRRSTASVVVPIVAAVAVLGAVGALAMFALNPGGSGSDSASQPSMVLSQSSASDSSSSSSSSSSSASSKSASSKSASSKSAASSSAASSTATGAGTTGTQTGQTGSTTGNGTSAGAAQGNTGGQQNAQVPQSTYEQPVQQTTGTDGSYYRGDTSTRYYTRGEVDAMSNYDIYYARNEIYARHGRMFDNADLQAYFNSKSWYTPLYTPAQWNSMANPLSDVEQNNVLLMLDVERDRKSPYL